MDNALRSICLRAYSGGKTGPLAGGEGSGWIKGKGGNRSNIMFGEGLKKIQVKGKQDGRKAFLRTSHSSIDPQHRTTFYAMQVGRSI